MFKDLKHARVFTLFSELCKIPHGSGNTKEISDYCVAFANGLGLFCIQDELGNVIIKKPAQGSASSEPVILQGHLDMVCERAADCDIDFMSDPLMLCREGDLLFAKGTTLGGDDGIAVAMALAVLEDKSLVHPPLEVLFTVDEETGMYGAEGVDTSPLEGRLLINIDSEEEGVLTVGCAGGARAEIELPLKRVENNAPAYKITVGGLTGGHSGVEIDKGRLNANMVMGKFLSELEGFSISSIAGGLKDNAIPVACESVIVGCDPTAAAARFQDENRIPTDPTLTLTVEAVRADECCDGQSTERIVRLLRETPNGIVAMSEHIKGLPETSLNLGILESRGDRLLASFAVRSSVSAAKDRLLSELEALCVLLGGSFGSHGHYPAWEYNPDSRLREVMCRVWREKTGSEPAVVVIHAGLECGLLSEKISGLDAVSIGPDMQDIHTCRERLSISSSQRVYEYLCAVLAQL